MPHSFDAAYAAEPFASLVRDYPNERVYPAADFRVEWGPIFHRGRLDGSPCILLIGQDPSHNENIVRRILVGEAGRRIQGFLAKLGIDRSYVMINTFLYSVYGTGGNRHRRDARIASYRNRWLDALLEGSKVEAVVALGTLADTAWSLWRKTGTSKKFTGFYIRIVHPTQPESAAKGNQAKAAALIKVMLENWNAALTQLSSAIQHPDRQLGLVAYGDGFKPSELADIPEFDMPAGVPQWMRTQDGWATRAGATDADKRANITITVPADALPAAPALTTDVKPSVSISDFVDLADFPRDVVAKIIEPPAGSKLALRGRVVCMDAEFTVLKRGTVYVEDGTITAVRQDTAPPPRGFEQVQVVTTGGTIYPGLIELHNHLSYNALKLWQVPQTFTNRDKWSRNNAQYKQLVSGPMKVIGGQSELIPSLVRYVECKCLLAGVTTSQGIALSSNSGIRSFYEGVIRTVERPDDPRLPAAGTRIPDVTASDRAAFAAELKKKKCFLLHLSEGTDTAARAHFQALQSGPGPNDWAITPSLTCIHCVALEPDDFRILNHFGASMVWSPMSNLLLYGATANVAAAKQAGLRVAIGSDWSPSGSKNLLGEFKVAQIYSQHNGGSFSDQEIVAMATREAAAILCWDKLIGSIEKGKLADFLVIEGTTGDPYSALIAATESSVKLVMIHGVAQYGSAKLMAKLGADTPGEPIKVASTNQILHLTSNDPRVPAVPLNEATEKLTEALKRLPELAHNMRRRMAAIVMGTAPTRWPEVWTLELDELQDTGMEMRPRLPLNSALTGAVRTIELSLPAKLQSLKLDPLTIADDSDFLKSVQQETNLPAYVKSELKKMY
jgi:5-methylthioadenosine/S-adenosylhomocysteine deaminase